MRKIDEIDLKLIDVLRENSKLSTSKISKKTGIPITTVFNRIKKIENEGIIEKYTVKINEKKLGNAVTAYSLIHYDISLWNKKSDTEISKESEVLRKQLLSLPNVREAKYIAGRYDILLKVVATSLESVNELLLRKLRKISGIGKTETFFVLEDIK